MAKVATATINIHFSGIDMFKNQDDYDSFRAWALEGSCLAQRMSESVEGGVFEIPSYWKKYKRAAKSMPERLKDLPKFLEKRTRR